MTIQARLWALKDAKYADFQRKLIPNIPPESIIGVRTPALRTLAKELYGTPTASVPFLRDVPHRYFEENQLHAFLLAHEKDFDTCLLGVGEFLPFVDNWATCDQLSPKVFGRQPERLIPSVQAWLSSGHEYTVRFAIGRLMHHFLDDRFREEYLRWVADIQRDEYYVRMMQAWYFATALAKQWDSTLPCLQPGRLGEWVRRKSIQKAIESYRIPADHKAVLRTLRG